LLQLLKKRRSIRKYTGEKVPEEKIFEIIKAALLAPTSKNSKPCEFIIVKDKNLLSKLSLAKPGAAFLKDSDFGVVILGDPSISDVWIEDASIAAIQVHLMSEYLGLGSCWIQIRERKYSEHISAEKYVRDLLDIPDSINVLAVVSIGHPDEKKDPVTEESLNYGKVYLDKYKSTYLE